MTKILLTGRPGIGKTTIIRAVVSELTGVKANGFYTQEIKEGTRKGFKLITLDGREEVLAHRDLSTPFRVGKYSVSLAGLERVGVPAIMDGLKGDLVVIDEIGRMELYSEKFRDAVMEALKSPTPLLGTIMAKPDQFVDRIKEEERVEVVEVTYSNRDKLAKRIADTLFSLPPEGLR